MDLNSQLQDNMGIARSVVSHYQLVLQQNGDHHYFIWRRNPPEAEDEKKLAMLIDLNHVYLPEAEIEKMVRCFLLPAGVVSIAFANCHSHNQQEIKRKLKAGDIELFSKTAFFADLLRAQKWIEGCVSNE